MQKVIITSDIKKDLSEILAKFEYDKLIVICDNNTHDWCLINFLVGMKELEENDSLICAELLGMRTGKIEPPRPSERTTEYYRERPCPRLVECACRIYAHHLANKND